MVTAADSVVRSRLRIRLAVAGGVLAGGLGLSALYVTTGIGLPCPLRSVTGWLCPLCGGTRMGEALLHGDLAGALAANPLALVAVALLGLLAVAWTIQLAGGPALALPLRLDAVLRRVPNAGWLVLAALVAVAYAVLRNLG